MFQTFLFNTHTYLWIEKYTLHTPRIFIFMIQIRSQECVLHMHTMLLLSSRDFQFPFSLFKSPLYILQIFCRWLGL